MGMPLVDGGVSLRVGLCRLVHHVSDRARCSVTDERIVVHVLKDLGE